MISRNISAALQKCKKSVLLLGPRQVGKSTLVRALKPELSIDLSNEEEFLNFASDPGALRKQLETENPKSIFIDEIQRLPVLLNTIQSIVDRNPHFKFYLTGSSARKLKCGQANLLPGRLLVYYLGPVVSSELGYSANEEGLLKFGSLPEVYLESDVQAKQKLLSSYVATYVNEEVRAESVVRNIAQFSRALPESILSSGRFVDYSKLAKRAKVSRHALARFYEIFEDTLLGMRVWPDTVLREKAELVKHPKFYVFDVGVYNSICRSYDLAPERLGVLFEHLFFNQLLHSAWSRDLDIEIASFRTRSGVEIDFIVTLAGKRFAIEVKAAIQVHIEGTLALQRIHSVEPKLERFIAYRGTKSIKVDGIWCHPWQVLLKEMGL